MSTNREYAKEINTIVERVTSCDCHACGGSGYYDNDNSPMCSACYGTGTIEAGYEGNIGAAGRVLEAWLGEIHSEYETKFDALDEDDEDAQDAVWQERTDRLDEAGESVHRFNASLKLMGIGNTLYVY